MTFSLTSCNVRIWTDRVGRESERGELGHHADDEGSDHDDGDGPENDLLGAHTASLTPAELRAFLSFPCHGLLQVA